MALPTIVVTGANGQLGSELKELHSQYPQFNWVFTTREELDLTDEKSIKAIFEKYKPNWFVNCAAYTAVDKAESEKDLSFAINETAPKIISKLCAENGVKLIHISTDYVFHGDGSAPYKPEDHNNPVNFYGLTKLKGEQAVVANNPESIIIRTAWVYSSYGKNFVKTMRFLMQNKTDLNVVADQLGTPTYAKDLAEAIIAIIQTENPVWGTYHFSNEGEISWFDFATAINQMSGFECNVHPIPTTDFPTPAKRPAYSVLDKEKIKNNFHIPIRYWVESLRECIDKLEKLEAK